MCGLLMRASCDGFPWTTCRSGAAMPCLTSAETEGRFQRCGCVRLLHHTRALALYGLHCLHVFGVDVCVGGAVIKTRLQQQEGRTNLKYKGAVHCATTVMKEEGFTALWRGVLPTMFRNGSNSAFNFGTMALLNAHWLQKREGDGQQVPVWKTSLAGLVSASVGPLFNCPVDVVKTRLMAQVCYCSLACSWWGGRALFTAESVPAVPARVEGSLNLLSRLRVSVRGRRSLLVRCQSTAAW